MSTVKVRENYIRIFATSFLIEDYRHSIEYRLIPTNLGYRLNECVHSGNRMFEYLTEWKTTLHYSNLDDSIYEIFNRLRGMELNNGLYKELNGTTIPDHIYTKKIEPWVDYATRLECRCFSIHGNHFKYLPKPSAEMKAYNLRVYENLKDRWQIPSATDLWFEELVKKEISIHNEAQFANAEIEEMPLPTFLKKSYPDFEDQIDRYLLHQKIADRNANVTSQNRRQVIDKFEHYLLPELDC